MQKKEHYWHILPHYQQPGQSYFVTWCLKDAVPQKAISRYKTTLNEKQNQIDLAKTQKIDDSEIKNLQNEYHLIRKKYITAYNNLLDSSKSRINLTDEINIEVVKEALNFWNGERLENYAYCIMPNHVHWVFRVFEKDGNGNPVYLQDIMHSVKRTTAYRINQILERKGEVWQKESFDTTIRDRRHLHHVIEYTLNNPVKAGFTNTWQDWPGCWLGDL